MFQTSEDVTIHNKYYEPTSTDFGESELMSVAESCTLPMLESVEMSPSGFDETVCDELCRDLSETPLPDLEEIVEVDITPAIVSKNVADELVNDEIDTEVVAVEEKKNQYLLVKKPIIPEVGYKWQRGFRRDSSGRYCKVSYIPDLSL